MHVLNSRIFSGAEKVVCQIITAFAGEVDMVYCSPESGTVGTILASQGISYRPIPSLTPKNLRSAIERERPDVIHAHDMRAGFVAALCCGGIPLISHIHNNAMDARGLSPKSLAYLLAGARARHIFWVSQAAFEGYRFHRLFARKSSVLYNIIDTRLIQERLAQDDSSYDFDVIYVGRLTYPKDPQRLMRVCARMKAKKPNLKVAVVGAGDLEDETKALCKELGLDDNVSFLGFRENPIKMIRDARVLTLISHWEGTPMCVLEAMALGTPVVATPSDGMRELIDSGISGWLCDTDEALAEKMLSIIEDPASRAALAQKASEKFARINDEASYKAILTRCYLGE
ncbi:MAG: glycosyltransferase [Eubacteriales bacterium]|nr:glycosyltransferase [Eubacteriales bacterium]